MSTIYVRLATLNAPESRKRGLLPDRLGRAERLFRFYQNRSIDVGAIQEAGTYAEEVDTAVPGVKAIWAAYNTLVKGRQVGNGILVKTARWRSRLLPDLVVGEGDDALHIAVAIITHRRTQRQFKFYAVHRPTRRADNAYLRDDVDKRLRQETRNDDKGGMPWVIAGDMNAGHWGWGTALAKYKVDHIIASKHFEPAGGCVVRRRLLSDHAFLLANARFSAGV